MVYPFFPCRFLTLGIGKGHGVQFMCIWNARVCRGSAIFTLRFEILKFPEKTQAWFQRENAWKTCDFGVTKKHEKQFFFPIMNLFSSRWFIAYTIIDQGDHGHARVCLESARKGIQGQSWSQWFWWSIGFILLDSPLYQYKGSCFREVCADEGAVGGNLRSSTGVYIRDYTIFIHVYLYSTNIILSFFRVKWKGYFQWIMHLLDRASLTGHFGSSGLYSTIKILQKIGFRSGP